MHRLRATTLLACLLGTLYAVAVIVPARAATDDSQARATAAGTTYQLPAGWTAAGNGDVVVLAPPEPDLKLAIVENLQASDGRAAAAAAWERYRPHAAHPVQLANARAGRNGWDEQVEVDYETSPAEHLDLQSLARRKGDHWTVLIVDGNAATSEKRASAIGQIQASLRPAGFTRESFAGRTARPLDGARVAQLLAFVQQGADALRIPGVGVALYSGGKIVYEGGVGVRNLEASVPVDAHTRFMIASNTKSMATLLLAELVSEGRLRWDDPVIKVYPEFRLGSDATTRSVLVRHLVCACTGLPRKDMEWLFTSMPDTPSADAFAQLAATEPTSKFGEVFQYNNLMAAAAGYIAAHLYYPDMELGAAFDRAVKEHITDPLAMHDTTLSMEQALAADHADPYGEDLAGKIVRLPQDLNATVRSLRPAGGAWSSPHDMILYMKNELDEGRLPDGGRLLSSQALLARRARGVPVGEDQWYGMGLMEDASWGVSVIHHGGDLSGYHSDMYAIPEAGVAAVLLTNGDNGWYLRRPFMRRLLELLYDGKPEAVGDLQAAVVRDRTSNAEFRAKLTIPGDRKVLQGLAPHYANPALGPLTISQEPGGTRLSVVPWNSLLVTRHNDDGSDSIVTRDPAVLGLEWVVGSDAGKRTLTLRDGQHVYVFTEAHR